VKCADQLVTLAKEQAVLQGTIERLIANWKMLRNGMEINVGKNSDDENLKTTIPNTDMTNQKQPENVEYFNYFGSMVTNCARYVRVIEFRIA